MPTAIAFPLLLLVLASCAQQLQQRPNGPSVAHEGLQEVGVAGLNFDKSNE